MAFALLGCNEASAPNRDPAISSFPSEPLPADLANIVEEVVNLSDKATIRLGNATDAVTSNAALVGLSGEAERLARLDGLLQSVDMDALTLDELEIMGERAVDLADEEVALKEQLDRLHGFKLSREAEAVAAALRLP